MRAAFGCFILGMSLASTVWGAPRYNTVAEGEVIAVEGTMLIIQGDEKVPYKAETARSGRDLKGQTHTYKSNCVIEVTGHEAVKNLQPGMALQVEAILANQRKLVGEPLKVTLINSSVYTQSGLTSSEPIKDDEDLPAVTNPPPGEQTRCLLVGRISRVRSGSITLTFPLGEKQEAIELFFRLPPEGTIEVKCDDLGFVHPGDKVWARGASHGLPHFFAREVKIEHFPVPDEKEVKRRQAAARAKQAALRETTKVELEIIQVK